MVNILLTVIFRPVLICPSSLVNDFTLSSIHPNKSCALNREIIWDIEICPFLKSLADNEDERGKNGENKKRANISLHSVAIF